MSEYQKLKRSLQHHPGVKIAAIFTAAFVLAGLASDDHIFKRALIGFSISLFFWAIVLTTAWTGRHIE